MRDDHERLAVPTLDNAAAAVATEYHSVGEFVYTRGLAARGLPELMLLPVVVADAPRARVWLADLAARCVTGRTRLGAAKTVMDTRGWTFTVPVTPYGPGAGMPEAAVLQEVFGAGGRPELWVLDLGAAGLPAGRLPETAAMG